MRSTTWVSTLLCTLAFSAASHGRARAEEPPVAPPAAPPAGAETPAPLTKAELATLVGPIALYPDVLLSSMLPATTAPLDVVAAARALEQAGGHLAAVPAGVSWDTSVQAMLQYPDVLLWMNQNLEWVKQMGYAVATQQQDVLAAIQEFRHKVQEAGNLKSDEHQTVTEDLVSPPAGAPAGATPQEVIYIQPTNPAVVYVPYYEPSGVCISGYSGWGWGLGFGVGLLGAWAYHDIYWGWPYWGYGYGYGHGHGYYGGYYGGIYHSPYHHYHGSVHNVGVRRPSAWQASRHAVSRRSGSVTSPGASLSSRTAGVNRGVRSGAGVQPSVRSTTGPTRQPLWTRTTSAPRVAGGTQGSVGTRSGGTRYPGTWSSSGRSTGSAVGSTRTTAGSHYSSQRPAYPRRSTGFSGLSSGSTTRQMSTRGGTSLRSAPGGSSFRGMSGRSMGSGGSTRSYSGSSGRSMGGSSGRSYGSPGGSRGGGGGGHHSSGRRR